MTSPLRVAIVADYKEEGWHSMDLVADALMRELPIQTTRSVEPTLVRPRLLPVVGHLAGNGGVPTADRVFNRFWLYPPRLRRLAKGCGVFHIVDHSYAHLALSLPRGRVITTCHDLDTFRGFVVPGTIGTSLPRFLVKRIAAGLRASALVACPSRTTAEEIVASNLVSAERVVVVPNGVEPPIHDPDAEREAERMLATAEPTIDLLHVGSTIERKRIDLLLDVIALAARSTPNLRLVRVGGPFSPAQEAQIERLQLRGRILVLPYLNRATLLAVYRRASLLLLTSDREGFGLPMIEALASGLPVVARDLPVLREVAGDSATFVGSTEPTAWSAAIHALVTEAHDSSVRHDARLASGRVWAARFSWRRYAEEMAVLYEQTAAATPQAVA
jgi:glycosyltransferase involved in cell wall biosynthesis